MQAAEQHSPRPQQQRAEGLATPPGQQQQQQVEDELRSAAVKMRLELPLKERCASCAGCHIMLPNCPAADSVAGSNKPASLACCDRIIHLQTFKYTFTGQQAVTFLQQRGLASNQEVAADMCQRMLSQSLFKSIYHREVFSADGEVYRFSSSFPDGNKQKARYVCQAAPSRQRTACRQAQGPSHACCVGHYQPAQCVMPSCAPPHASCHAMLCRADVSSRPAPAGSPAASPPQDCTRRSPKSARQQLSPSKTSSCR